MPKYLFTLPIYQKVNTIDWDWDGLVMVEAKDVKAAKQYMTVKFGNVWANVYNFERFDFKLFPKGIIKEFECTAPLKKRARIINTSTPKDFDTVLF